MFKALSAVLILVITNSHAAIVKLPNEDILTARIQDALKQNDIRGNSIWDDRRFLARTKLAHVLADRAMEAHEIVNAVKLALLTFMPRSRSSLAFIFEREYLLIKTILLHDPDAFEGLILTGKMNWVSLKTVWETPDDSVEAPRKSRKFYYTVKGSAFYNKPSWHP